MSLEDLSLYFRPLSSLEVSNEVGTIGHKTEFYVDEFPEIEKKSIVLLDCPEYRNATVYKGISETNNRFRNYFYNLYGSEKWNFNIYDLGTILPGEKTEDTYFALATVVSKLIKNDCLPIIIGGSHDLTYGIYKGYQSLEQTVNITNVDYKFDLGNFETSINDNNYLSHILTSRPCTLFNYSIIGTQQPFLSDTDMKLMDNLYFDYCRLGDLMSNFKIAEPLIRNSDILTIDMLALKALDGTSEYFTNPNGISSETICQIAKYAGISDRLSSLLVTNCFLGTSKLNDNLLAQIMWYFIDGYSARYGDFPISTLKDYLKFTVNLTAIDEQIVFYKSKKSERWWMEVPYPKKTKLDYKRHTIVPCNLEDYEQAMNNDIPNLWWKTFQKLLS